MFNTIKSLIVTRLALVRLIIQITIKALHFDNMALSTNKLHLFYKQLYWLFINYYSLN